MNMVPVDINSTGRRSVTREDEMLEPEHEPTLISIIIQAVTWLISGLLAIVGTLGLFIMGSYRRKIENLEGKIELQSEAQKKFVTREELEDYFNRITQD